jgi:phage shock protein PspC (stress-responsive transcriptional regulator)
MWAAIVGVVIGLAMAFGVDGNDLKDVIALVTGAMTVLGSIASYISGEATIDAARAQNSTPINISVTDDNSGEDAE